MHFHFYRFRFRPDVSIEELSIVWDAGHCWVYVWGLEDELYDTGRPTAEEGKYIGGASYDPETDELEYLGNVHLPSAFDKLDDFIRSVEGDDYFFSSLGDAFVRLAAQLKGDPNPFRSMPLGDVEPFSPV